ncbi:MAG: pilus assembly PilX N-terminal domain-containing protein [Desulfamplus sp.]|nr:pilus assembly PilX N-terminal domain-containing protein [Desulfamplus sp.]
MNKLLQKIRLQTDIIKNLKLKDIYIPINNNNGSIMVIAIMLLAIITIIGLTSSETVVTEQFIIRNQAIYKQNLNMVESAAMEGLQFFMQRPPDDQNIVTVAGSTILNNINSNLATNVWYASGPSGQLLKGINVLPINIILQNLQERGEVLKNNNLVAKFNLAAAFFGWENVPMQGGGSESLGIGANKPIWRQGRLLTEYVSTNNSYGTLRMEIGLKRRLVQN